MKFNNHNNIPMFDDFLSNYGTQINALWPQIKGFELEVIDLEHWSDILANSVWEFKPEEVGTTPYYVYLGIHKDEHTVFHFIGQNAEIIEMLGLDEKEKFALIAHEVGHLIAYVDAGCKPICCTDVTEEFFPDDCAVKLGLGDEIKSVLSKMYQSEVYSTDEHLMFDIRRNRL